MSSSGYRRSMSGLNVPHSMSCANRRTIAWSMLGKGKTTLLRPRNSSKACLAPLNVFQYSPSQGVLSLNSRIRQFGKLFTGLVASYTGSTPDKTWLRSPVYGMRHEAFRECRSPAPQGDGEGLGDRGGIALTGQRSHRFTQPSFGIVLAWPI